MKIFYHVLGILGICSAHLVLADTLKQGPIIETCVYGEGEAKITVIIHKEIKKGVPKTADLIHGTTFKRMNMKLERTPVDPHPDYSYQSLSDDEKYYFHVSYGPTLQASMDYKDAETTFQTNSMKCKGRDSNR